MFHRPQSTAEALALLALDGATILAGGTDVFPALVDRPPPKRLVDISLLSDLRGISRQDKTVRIGAATTWAEIARAVMERHPAAWLFFITFILLATFTVLNLFIALIVKAMEDPAVGSLATHEAVTPAGNALREPSVELGALRAEIAALRLELAMLVAQLPRTVERSRP